MNIRCIVFLFCTSIVLHSQTHLKGEIGVRVFEPSYNPHIVEEPITITEGSTVTIKKGTIFLFKNYTGLKVAGNLIIEGTESEPVIFTSINDKEFNPDATLLPNAFDWNGIAITTESGTVELHHFKLSYSVYGIKSKNDNILINQGLFSNNGQCDVVINDELQIVLQDEPFTYPLQKSSERQKVQTNETQAKDSIRVETQNELEPTDSKEATSLDSTLTPHKHSNDTINKMDSSSLAPVNSSQSTKIGNRSGFRISLNLFPGNFPMAYYDSATNTYEDVVDETFFDSIETQPGYSSVSFHKFLMRFNTHFMIRLGSLFSLDVGPGLLVSSRKGGYVFDDVNNGYYVDHRDISWHWLIIAPNVSSGINFVKYFHPIKVHAGILFDVNLNILKYNFAFTEDGQLQSGDPYAVKSSIDDTDFAINTAVGPRAGVELQVGSSLGIHIDFLYRFSILTKEFDLTDSENDETSKVKWKFYLPGVGVGAGVNFYF